MKRAFVWLIFCFLVPVAYSQKTLTSREIFQNNRDAVVQIWVDDHFSGAGFIVSADGLIITANHVIATEASERREYASKMRVFLNGKVTPYPVTLVAPTITSEQRNFDVAEIKIHASNLPHVTLGTWKETDVGDQLTIIPAWPGLGPMMITGIVSNRATFQTFLGPKPVDTILFQAPVRKGFSGSPIFAKDGRVIAVVDTLVFGISPALADLRTQWDARNNSVFIGGIDTAASFSQIIDGLDGSLISGLGSGFAIDYAKQENTKK